MSFPDPAGESAGNLKFGQLVKVESGKTETVVAIDGFSAMTHTGTLLGCGASFEATEDVAESIELSDAAKGILTGIGTLESVEAAILEHNNK